MAREAQDSISLHELMRLCVERGLLIVAVTGAAQDEQTGVVVQASSDHRRLKDLPQGLETSSSGPAQTAIRIAAQPD